MKRTVYKDCTFLFYIYKSEQVAEKQLFIILNYREYSPCKVFLYFSI